MSCNLDTLLTQAASNGFFSLQDRELRIAILQLLCSGSTAAQIISSGSVENIPADTVTTPAFSITSPASGLYRVDAYLNVVVPSAFGTCTPTLQFTDRNGNQREVIIGGSAGVLDMQNDSQPGQGGYDFFSVAGTPINVFFFTAGVVGPGTFDAYSSLTRLS